MDRRPAATDPAPWSPGVPPPGVESLDDLVAVLWIRHFELNLLRLFDEGHVAGTTHTCPGQEYLPVALSAL